ncbi:hypothetical protein E2562_006111 [Oryza meyeriana var. granulata]|uniref:Uncharacterized protein n=1 Tax=Oryza meyeriana var. granulata TaxID=110450 RepID=A0A6G1EVM4_9ORYZ|nr:hypothetical protein E2562_006111 [Oryza meyeriana var. granulata]KAF0928686.1 hypothetical protein E2562_006111 [Oryza meyeriana var. granulata]
MKSMTDLIEKELSIFSNPEECTWSTTYLCYGYWRSLQRSDGGLHCFDHGRGNTSLTFLHTWQSRVGSVQWLKPYTDEVLFELGQQGVKSLLAVPVSFVSEHIETLEEIDMEYKELALESGIRNWGSLDMPHPSSLTLLMPWGKPCPRLLRS